MKPITLQLTKSENLKGYVWKIRVNGHVVDQTLNALVAEKQMTVIKRIAEIAGIEVVEVK